MCSRASCSRERPDCARPMLRRGPARPRRRRSGLSPRRRATSRQRAVGQGCRSRARTSRRWRVDLDDRRLADSWSTGRPTHARAAGGPRRGARAVLSRRTAGRPTRLPPPRRVRRVQQRLTALLELPGRRLRRGELRAHHRPAGPVARRQQHERGLQPAHGGGWIARRVARAASSISAIASSSPGRRLLDVVGSGCARALASSAAAARAWAARRQPPGVAS